MVDDKLKILDGSMDRISNLALKIDETFKFKRKEIKKLDTVNKDLQKLRNLCDFPNILKQDLTEYKSIAETKLPKSFSEDHIFKKSINLYRECFQTLYELRSEPLIEPIYKESVIKIEELKSILKTKLLKFKEEVRKDARILKAIQYITKSLIILSDDQGQMSALRIYFSLWKDQANFNKKSVKNNENKRHGKDLSLNDLVGQTFTVEINEQFWEYLSQEFRFVYGELYENLVKSQ